MDQPQILSGDLATEIAALKQTEGDDIPSSPACAPGAGNAAWRSYFETVAAALV